MNAPLRIIQVVNVRWFNATAWYALFLSRLLQEAGHEVLVLGLPGTASFAKAQEWGLCPVPLDLNAKTPAALARLHESLAGIVRNFAPHVVNCHRGENFFLWCLLRRSFPFALVRTRGDQRPPKGGVVNRLLYTRWCDKHIATNSATAFELTHALRCENTMVDLVLGGGDTNVFRFDAEGRERVRREFGFTPQQCVLGFLGRFDPVKGVRELLFATGAALARRFSLPPEASVPDVRVLLAGFASLISEAKVLEWSREAGLEDRVVITGKRPDVAACISAMDIGVAPSQGSETIARAAFEIMSCGVPLLACRVGVMPDLLPPWALSPPADHVGLTHLLEQAITGAAFVARLREEGLKRVATLSESDFVRQTLEAYGAAMQHRNL